VTTKAPAAGRRHTQGSLADKGTAAIEFALIAPALILLLLGTVQFALVLANYVALTNAANVGAMQFSISRSDTTPYTDTVSAIQAAAPNLTAANMTITLSVNGTACTSDSTCATALTNAAPSSGGSLQPASVTVSYPCGSQWTWYNFWAAACQLTSSMTEGVQ
jgi:Flp pilus assembly protein TadG